MSRARLAAFAAVVALVAIPAAFADSTYTDPPGDSGPAPDITQVVVSNDTAGVITFRITIAAPFPNNAVFFVDIDSDGNPSTGDHGTEYSIIGALGGFMLEKWDGSAYQKVSAPSLTMSISGNVIEAKIGRQEIGNVSRFGFGAYTVAYDGSGTYLDEDDAPDGGSFAYVLTFPQCANGADDDGDGKVDAQDLGCSSQTDDLESDDPVTLKAGKATMAPANPVAGKIVVISAPVTRVETGLGVTSGTASCVAHVGPKTIRAAGKVTGGRGSCALRLPLSAKGKRVAGTITVTVLGHSTTAPFAFKAS
jgi:hypothetical protein